MISPSHLNNEAFLLSMRATDTRLRQLQQQLSSGIRVETPADSPQDVHDILMIKSRNAQLDQSEANLSRVKTEVDVAESALREATTLLDRVRQLGVQGASDTSSGSRQALALEVESILGQMVQLANSKVAGRFVFGGDQDEVAPYKLDLAAASGVERLNVSAATRRVDDGAGAAFVTSSTAAEIFDAGGGSVFAAVNRLRLALADDDAAAARDALDSLEPASAHLSSALAHHGVLQNRINGALLRAGDLKLQTAERLRDLQETDAAAAIVESQMLETQRDAALAMQAQAGRRRNLFDYL